jgi:PAS domain S-box-containing protein
MKVKNSIARTYLQHMLIVTFIAITLIGYFWIKYEYSRFEQESLRLRQHNIATQKNRVRAEVEKVIDYIDYKRAQTERRLKGNIKSRTYEAHSIALNIYEQNRDLLSDEAIGKMIKDALRPIRYNAGRGYYFATRLDGVEMLFADHPEMEGKNLIDMKNSQGKYVIGDMIRIVGASKEGFYQYAWSKPGASGTGHQKIAFVKFFEPYNWFIGTGEYLQDVEEDIQQEVLDRISRVRFGDDGYIFVVSYDGVTLMNGAQPHLIGQNLWEMIDPDGIKVIQAERKAVSNPQGGYIHYSWEKPNTNKIAPKVSFIRGVPDWKWMIGAGTYLDDIERDITHNRTALARQVRTHILFQIIPILIILFAIIYLTASHISRRAKRSFKVFSEFFEKAAFASTSINQAKLSFFEFAQLAPLANKMIHERRRAEDANKRSSDLLSTVVEGTTDCIYIKDREGRYLLTNANTINLLDKPAESVIGQTDESLLEPEVASRRIETEQAIMQSGVAETMEETVETPSGNTTWLSMKAPYRDSDGNVIGIIVISRDITEFKKAEKKQRKLEARMQQAQKLESLGVLAGGIAHDFNNLLMGIMGNAELAMEDISPEHPAHRSLQGIEKASHRCADLSRQMLAYSGKGKFVIYAINLNAMMTEMQDLIESSISKISVLKYDFTENLPSIEADISQMQQVLMNLITNASEALGEKAGMIIVSTGVKDCDRAFLRHTYLDEKLPEGKYVYIEVTDTGCGMDKETQAKIFDPFFTTKFTGRGLGLAALLGIVRGHNGAIQVNSQPDMGASIKVLFPALDEPVERLPAESKESTQCRNGGTVLLVDDEEIILAVGKRMLERSGFVVQTAESGDKAIEAFRQRADEIDCVLLDLSMPYMDGEETFVELRKIRENVRVILSSGYNAKEIEERFADRGLAGFISKPYNLNDLKTKIMRILES